MAELISNLRKARSKRLVTELLNGQFNMMISRGGGGGGEGGRRNEAKKSHTHTHTSKK